MLARVARPMAGKYNSKRSRLHEQWNTAPSGWLIN